MIKVLITEDSPVVRGYLQHILNSDPDIQVVGTAHDGEEAVRMAMETKPDVITMDIHMPKMDGFEATRKIMETHPVPVVIVSASWNPDEVDKTFRTMEAGAVAALEKPRGMGQAGSSSSIQELVSTVKLMSEVKVVRRWTRMRKGTAAAEKSVSEPLTEKISNIDATDIKLIAMGASTGGPLVLQTILSGLGPDFGLPVVIVQHIAPGFLSGLAEWLTRTTSFPVHIASHDEKLEPGNAYLAPDGQQMGVDRRGRVILSDAAPEHSVCPSVSFLFRSVAQSFGKQVIGVLLTGMGQDGSTELKLIKDKGGITIAQDRESSTVHGMPGEAIKRGSATDILSSKKIAERIHTVLKKQMAVSAG